MKGLFFMPWRAEAWKLREEGKSYSEIRDILYPTYGTTMTEKKYYEKVKGFIYKREHRKGNKESRNIKVPESNRKVSYNSTTGLTESSTLISVVNGKDIDEDFLLEAHGLDKTKWKIDRYTNNYWNSQVKGGSKIDMYQSKITVRPRNGEVSLSWLEEWFKKFKVEEIKIDKSKDYGEGDMCLVVPIVDLHYNLLTTNWVSGDEYNCDVARDRFNYIIDDVISRVRGKKVAKIILPVGNDLFNANGLNGTTFKGTLQTNQKCIQEAYIELFNILVSNIVKLAQVAPVDVIYIPSNHDKEITFYFLYNLYTEFRENSEVSVDYSPRAYKCRRFGKTLMMFSHDLKVDKAGNIVLDEAKGMVDGVDYIEVFLAHLHHESVKNERNISVRRLPTIGGVSKWSEENGYSSNKVSQSFLISENKNIYDIMFSMPD